MPTEHGMDLQQDAAARPSALNVIRAPGKAESVSPAYVLVEYAPESGETDLCLQCAGGRAEGRLPLVFGHVCACVLSLPLLPLSVPLNFHLPHIGPCR
jgi:hypothetical protein